MDLEAFLEVACGLLAVRSTADQPAELRRALDYVLDYVGPGFTIERFERNAKPSALVYFGADRPDFRVILNAHLDVVPAEAAQFRPRRDGGRLYARGAQDMKVTGLAQALAFRELAGILPYPLGLQLVTDEEVGGQDGTNYQLEQGVTGRFALIGEHSALRVVNESKGILTAYLRATGRGGHGAYPWLGDNALVKLMKTLNAVLAAYPVAAEPAWRTTVNIARIETLNRAFNQIPAEATAWLDFRFPPGDADLNGTTIANVTEHLRAFCDHGVSVTVNHLEPPHRAAPDSLEVQALQHAARAQGYSGELLRKHGSGDVRFYAQRGIDAVVFGIGGDGQHDINEYADIGTIEPYCNALTQFLYRLAGAKASRPGD